MRLFADDCVIYTTIRTTDDQLRLNTTLANIACWCLQWGMEINVSKTACLSITRRKTIQHFNYNLVGTNIARNDTVKYLGITFTSKLKWDAHVNSTYTKAYRQLGFLRRKLALTPSNVKLTAYKSLIRPILEYASIVWNPHQKYLSNKLENVQHKALRFIYSKYSRHDSVTELRRRACLPTLAARRRVCSLKFLFLLYHNR